MDGFPTRAEMLLVLTLMSFPGFIIIAALQLWYVKRKGWIRRGQCRRGYIFIISFCMLAWILIVLDWLYAPRMGASVVRPSLIMRSIAHIPPGFLGSIAAAFVTRFFFRENTTVTEHE